MKTFRQILNETRLAEKVADKRLSVNESATPRNQISMEDLYHSFDVDGDGVVSEADYAAHIAWHMENAKKLEKATSGLEGEHLEHVANPDAFCASEQTDNYDKEADFVIVEDKHLHPMITPPAMIVMKRLSVRQFSNGERVALYYSKTINRYLTVPYNDAGINDLTKNIGKKD
jgi:hypothetical protein